MNKKIIIGIIIILVIIVLAIGGYFLMGNKNEDNNTTNDNTSNVVTDNNTTNTTATDENSNTESNNTKTLVVYFSAQGHTEEVAQKIANNLNADIFEIVPVDEYTSEDLDWTDDNSRVTREYEDESLRNIELVSTTVENWEEYDTVLIGYPIWWGIAAWPVNTFVSANDFNGKTVIPFCTSSSSGLGESGELLAQEASSGDWQEGHRFSSNPSDSDIKSWTDSLFN